MIKSYESCKWYVKIWRSRWYFIIPFIFIKRNFKISYLFFIYQPDSTEREKSINSWFDIKKHIELCKLHKYS